MTALRCQAPPAAAGDCAASTPADQAVLGGWTLRYRQTRPDLVRVERQDSTVVVRVGGSATGHRHACDVDETDRIQGTEQQQRARGGHCQVELSASGQVTVGCSCAPPAIHLTTAGQEKPLPPTGAGRCHAALRHDESLLLMSSAVVEYAPAVVRLLLDARPGTAPGPRGPLAEQDLVDMVVREIASEAPSADVAVAVLHRVALGEQRLT